MGCGKGRGGSGWVLWVSQGGRGQLLGQDRLMSSLGPGDLDCRRRPLLHS